MIRGNRDIGQKGLFIVRRSGQYVVVTYNKTEILLIDIAEVSGNSVRLRFDGPKSFEITRPQEPTKECRMCK